MKANEIMTRRVLATSSDDTIVTTARMMARVNVGMLPVIEGARVVGLITGRDIVVRVIAAGKPPAECVVGDVMTEEVHYCLEDDCVEDVAKRMGEMQVRRMPVLERVGALLGMISLDDIASHVGRAHTVTNALRRIPESSRPA